MGSLAAYCRGGGGGEEKPEYFSVWLMVFEERRGSCSREKAFLMVKYLFRAIKCIR